MKDLDTTPKHGRESWRMLTKRLAKEQRTSRRRIVKRLKRDKS